MRSVGTPPGWMATRTAALILVALAASCSRRATEEGERLHVFVSIPPQAYFVEKVGGDHVRVEVLVQPGQSPHVFTPTTDQVARLARSRIYFRIGLPFEDRLVAKIRATHAGLKIADTTSGIEYRRMQPAHHNDHDAGAHSGHETHESAEAGHAAGEHDHPAGAPDPHTWLNPRNVMIMARHIAEALEEADPAHAPDYERNLKAFQKELAETDARLKEALAPLRGREFMVFHPAFGYFADAYGLRQLPVEIEGKDPDARSLARLIETARARKIRVIFVQPQFSPRRAEAIAEAIGGSVVSMDPLARDYLKNLEEMARKVKRALAERRVP